MNHLIKLNQKTIWLIFACLLLTVIFQKNFLGFADKKFFDNFQTDSEALVVGGIVADDYFLDKNGANLGYISTSGKFEKSKNLMDSYEVFSGKVKLDDPDFFPYKSSYGFQSILFSKLHEIGFLNKLSHLQFVASALLAIEIVALFILYCKIYDKRFSWLFLVGTASSPWIIAISKNLYWLPFMWFLPVFFAALLYVTNNKYRSMLLFCITFSFFIKCLCGYEYLSTITIYTCSVFIIAPFFHETEPNRQPNYKMAFLVFFSCVLGFVFAFLLHAGLRGDSIASGILNIYEEDIKRRTYGDPAVFEFDPLIRPSLEASPISVLKTYMFYWYSDLVFFLPGKLFKIFFVISMLGLFCKYFIKHPSFKRDIVLFCFMFLAPVSWFVLAKGHSYVHKHINYVLWYLGFVPALLYVSMNSMIVIWSEFVNRFQINSKDF